MLIQIIVILFLRFMLHVCSCRIDYTDLSTELTDKDNQYKAKSVYEPAAFAFKNLKIFGATAYLDEFHETARTMPPGFNPESPESPPPSPSSGMSSPSISPCFNDMAEQLAKSSKISLLPSIQIGSFSGHLELKIKLKQNISIPGSKVSMGGVVGSMGGVAVRALTSRHCDPGSIPVSYVS
jgi:hypothetical protein